MKNEHSMFSKIIICLVIAAMLLPCFSVVSHAVTSDELRSLVTLCRNYRKDCWTENTWFDFKTALDRANGLLAQADADSDDFANAYNTLALAKKSLEHDGSITQCPYCLGQSTGVDESDIVSLTNVTYSPISERNTIDLNIPTNVTGGCGFILYIHGGGWTTGSKIKYAAEALQSCKDYGVVTGTMNYRYASEEVNAFDMVDDIQAAVAKAKQVAAEYGIDLTKMIIFGQSAGGHLAMLYAYSRADISAIEPVCVLDESGPADLTNPKYWESYLGEETISDLLSYLSGKTITDAESQEAEKEALLAVSPVSYVNSNSVPTIICHGTRDIVVDYSEAQRLATVFESNSAQYELITFNANHSIHKDEKKSAYAKERFDYHIKTDLYGNCPNDEHNYCVTNTPKTCTSDGYNMYVCSVCGKYYVSDIVNAEHTVISETVTPATYTSAGSQIKKCSVCGEILEVIEIPMLVAQFSVKSGSSVIIDDRNNFLLNIPQGTDDLSGFFDLEGCVVVSNDFITATGSSIVIKSVSNETIGSFTAVVNGDVTGDGYVDAFDVATISSVANFEIDFKDDSAYLFAADLEEDGYIDAFDCSVLTAIANFES